MGRSMIPAEDLAEDDLIDLVPILDDAQAHPWIWQPFGEDDNERRNAVQGARMIAECEYAAVESVEVGAEATVIYTDQMNVTVPRGYLVKRSVDA
jgi:hypothetical protein